MIIPPLGGEGHLWRGGSIRSNVNITVMEFEKQIPRRVLRNANGILPRTPSGSFALTVKFCLLNFQGLYLKASTTGGIFSYSAGPN